MTGEPKGKAARARTEILTAAAKMMRDGGYSAMSLRDLAAQVGMKAGSLYYHFPSRDALASEVMQLGVEIVAQVVSSTLAAQPDASARERLLLAMQVHLETLLSASDFTSAHIRCFPYAPEETRQKLTNMRQTYDRLWDDLISDLLGDTAPKSEVRQMRHALLGAMNWALEWFDPERDDINSYVKTLERLLPRGA